MRTRTQNARSQARAAAPRHQANGSSKARARKAGISEEFLYLTENAKALEVYPGQWLLIEGYNLLAHSADFRDIQAEITRHRIRSPFIYYVPTPEEANFISI